MARKKYIFSINTGRSGSHYLYNLFSLFPNCRAFHEPKPKGNGRAMRDFLHGNSGAMEVIAQKKAHIMRRLLRDDEYYVETNHCFIKGFGWYLPKYLPEDEIGVIILTRQEEDIVNSMLRIGASPLLPAGRDWIIIPTIPHPHVPPPDYFNSPYISYQIFRFIRYFYLGRRLYRKFNLPQPSIPGFIHQYERECLMWYVDETNAMAEAYQQRFPLVDYVSIGLNELNQLSGIEKIAAHFELEINEAVKNLLGTATNQKRPAIKSQVIAETER